MKWIYGYWQDAVLEGNEIVFATGEIEDKFLIGKIVELQNANEDNPTPAISTYLRDNNVDVDLRDFILGEIVNFIKLKSIETPVEERIDNLLDSKDIPSEVSNYPSKDFSIEVLTNAKNAESHFPEILDEIEKSEEQMPEPKLEVTHPHLPEEILLISKAFEKLDALHRGEKITFEAPSFAVGVQQVEIEKVKEVEEEKKKRTRKVVENVATLAAPKKKLSTSDFIAHLQAKIKAIEYLSNLVLPDIPEGLNKENRDLLVGFRNNVTAMTQEVIEVIQNN